VLDDISEISRKHSHTKSEEIFSLNFIVKLSHAARKVTDGKGIQKVLDHMASVL